MAEVRFYHLERQTLDQVLPQLLTKALQNGHRIVVKAANENQVEHLNTHLWTYDHNSFLPHGSAKDGNETNQPVWISEKLENPNKSDVLVLAQEHETPEIEDTYTLVCDMIDGRNDDAVAAARERWKAYKDAGHDVTYWQQSPQGAWEKKSG
ncbi:MAG: DNA polymerase III subunit chi [Pseudomonadota bacterium]